MQHAFPLYIKNVEFFLKLQKKYIFCHKPLPYKAKKQNIVSELKIYFALNVTGDARCSSPGFSAKYGTYSFMNPQSNEIIDFILMLAVWQILL